MLVLVLLPRMKCTASRCRRRRRFRLQEDRASTKTTLTNAIKLNASATPEKRQQTKAESPAALIRLLCFCVWPSCTHQSQVVRNRIDLDFCSGRLVCACECDCHFMWNAYESETNLGHTFPETLATTAQKASPNWVIYGLSSIVCVVFSSSVSIFFLPSTNNNTTQHYSTCCQFGPEP